MLCPKHNVVMDAEATKFGPRYQCPKPGCTVACWGGRTSTPADAETRALRVRCHELFDPLWEGYRARFQSRNSAYQWLTDTLALTRQTCHIGMFDSEQCSRLISILETFAEGEDHG